MQFCLQVHIQFFFFGFKDVRSRFTDKIRVCKIRSISPGRHASGKVSTIGCERERTKVKKDNLNNYYLG